MAVKKTILKVLFSAAAALVLISSVYFLLGKNVKGLGGLLASGEGQEGGAFPRDLIGRSIELQKQNMNEALAVQFTRRIAGENEKIDYLLEQVSSPSLFKTNDKGAVLDLIGFVQSNPLVERVRLINSRNEILLSTSDTDSIGQVLDGEIYGELFIKPPLASSRVMVDEGMESIVIYRSIDSAYALLFYYDREFLNSIFSGIPGFEYEGALLSADRIVFINFPVFDVSDAENFRNLSQMILAQESGFIRVRRDELDKTIYFQPASQEISEWIVAVTFDTAHVRISQIGALILIVQAVVVAAIIIFILTTIRERKAIPMRRARSGAIHESGGAETGGQAGRGVADRTGLFAGSSRAGSTSDGVLEKPTVRGGEETQQSGIIPLEDVEVIEEFEEVGEAEVAEEYEESRFVSDVTEAPEFTAPIDESEQFSPKNVESQVQGTMVEETRRFDDTRELENLEAVQREIMGPEAQLLDEMTELDELGDAEEQAIVEQVHAEIEDSVINDLEDIEQRTERSGDVLPDLEALVDVESSPEKESSTEDATRYLKGKPAAEEKGLSDELYDAEEEMSRKNQFDDTFGRFLESIGVSRGAVFLRQKNGQFRAYVTSGFSNETELKLRFAGNEKIVQRVLQRNKILFIRDDAFVDDELRGKFGYSDSSKIKSIFFAPLYTSEKGLIGFIMLCPSTGESFNPNDLLKKIKETIEKLIQIL